MGPIGCPETSVTNYQHSPRDVPEERRYLLRGGGMKSRLVNYKQVYHQQTAVLPEYKTTPACFDYYLLPFSGRMNT